MLRKRTRPVHSNQMADSHTDSCFTSGAVTPKGRGSSFFSVPGLLVGLSTKGSSDSETARSPTSPLEYRSFSNLGSSSFTRSPRSPGLEGGHPRNWDCSRVGLGLVDSLRDETKPCGKVLGISLSKTILFGSQVKINIPSPKSHLDAVRDDPFAAATKSLPKDFGFSSRIRGGSPYSQLGCPKVAVKSGVIREGSPRSQLGCSKMTAVESSGISEVEGPSELGKIHSCSTEMGASSTTLYQLMHPNIDFMSEIFSSDSRDGSQMESPPPPPPPMTGGMGHDDFSSSLPISISSSHNLVESLSASEIELSEDYTCIISHGPNPKMTHIFGDRILETHTIQSPSSKNKTGKEGRSPWIVKCSEDSPTHPSDDFLNLCFSCKKKLVEGEDIYIYRGEKAFCSGTCRGKEILIEEEEMQKPATDPSDSPRSFSDEEIFLVGLA